MNEIIKSLLMLGTIFPEQQLNKHLVELYCELLKEHDTDKVVNACDKWAVTKRYFPKPVDLIELIDGF